MASHSFSNVQIQICSLSGITENSVNMSAVHSVNMSAMENYLDVLVNMRVFIMTKLTICLSVLFDKLGVKPGEVPDRI